MVTGCMLIDQWLLYAAAADESCTLSLLHQYSILKHRDFHIHPLVINTNMMKKV